MQHIPIAVGNKVTKSRHRSWVVSANEQYCCKQRNADNTLIDHEGQAARVHYFANCIPTLLRDASVDFAGQWGEDFCRIDREADTQNKDTRDCNSYAKPCIRFSIPLDSNTWTWYGMERQTGQDLYVPRNRRGPSAPGPFARGGHVSMSNIYKWLPAEYADYHQSHHRHRTRSMLVSVSCFPESH